MRIPEKELISQYCSHPEITKIELAIQLKKMFIYLIISAYSKNKVSNNLWLNLELHNVP